MSPRELNRAVARATGESVAMIERLGFLLADPELAIPDADDERLGPHVIDWDSFDAARYVEQPLRPRVARSSLPEAEVCGAAS